MNLRLSSVAVVLVLLAPAVFAGLTVDTFEDGDYSALPAWSTSGGAGGYAINSTSGMNLTYSVSSVSDNSPAGFVDFATTYTHTIADGDNYTMWYSKSGGGDAYLSFGGDNAGNNLTLYLQGATTQNIRCGKNGGTLDTYSGTADTEYILSFIKRTGGATNWRYEIRLASDRSLLDSLDFTCDVGTNMIATKFYNYVFSDGGVASVDEMTYDDPTVSNTPEVNVNPLSPDNAYHTANGTGATYNNFHYNVSLINTNTSAAYCSVWLNSTIIDTSLVSANWTVNITSYQIAAEGDYTWFVNCTGTGGAPNSSTANRTLFVDRTNPTANPTSFMAVSSANTTVLSRVYNGTTLRLSWNLSDTYLWASNITISKNSNGTRYYNDTAYNYLVSTLILDKNISVAGWAAGVYNLSLVVEDDHTAKRIGNYLVTKDLATRTLEVTTDSGAYIKLVGTSASCLPDDFDAWKNVDRYQWSLHFPCARAEYNLTFNLSSSHAIFYRGDLYPFPAFVLGKHWVDFDAVNATGYTVVPNGAGGFLVTIKTSSPTMLFRSLGGLNTIEVNYQFSISDSPTQITDLTNPESGTTWLVLAYTNAQANATLGSTLYNSTGSVLYNGTNTSVYFNKSGLETGASYTFWALTWWNDGGVFRYNTSSSSGNNLTTATPGNGSVTIRLFDEQTLGLLTGVNASVDLIGFDVNESNSYTTTTGVITALGVEASNYTFRYWADSYPTRFYYAQLDNTTNTEINLTLLNSTAATNISVFVYDKIGNELPLARVKILKYYISTNSDRLVEIVETNLEGQTQFTGELNGEYYRFIVEYPAGTQRVFTERTYIYETTLQFYIGLTSGGTTTWEELTTLRGNITPVSALEYTFTFNDLQSTATQGCLEAWVQTSSAYNYVNISCLASSAGSVSLTLPNVSNVTYFLKGLVMKGGTPYRVAATTFSTDSKLANNVLGYLLLAVFVIVLFFVTLWRLEVALIVSALGVLAFSYTGLINIPSGVALGLVGLATVLAFVINRGKLS